MKKKVFIIMIIAWIAIIASAVGIRIRFSEKEPLSEEQLLAITQSACGHQPEHYVYVDMDHDGFKELIGVFSDDKGLYQTWYCSSDGKTCLPVHENTEIMDACILQLLDLKTETHVVMMVHTWKDTYLYFDGTTYREYVAEELTESDYFRFTNSRKIKTMIADELTQSDTTKLEYSYFIRKNNIVHIQCNVYNHSGAIQYGYYTVRCSGNVLDPQLGEYTMGQMASCFSDWDVT